MSVIQSNRDNVNKRMLSAFRKRWRRTTESLSKDAHIAYDAFEAPSVRDQKSLSKAYYSKSHALKMTNSTQDDILGRLRPLCNYLSLLPKREVTQKYVDLIISSEYLVFTSEDTCNRWEIDLDEDIGNWIPTRYPSDVLYDDWYEHVGGFNTEFLCVLMKSTGESFSQKEQHLLKQAVVENVTSQDYDELWVFDFASGGQAENQMVVYITGDLPKSHYVEPIVHAIESMSKGSIVQFAERIVALEKGGKADLPVELVDVVMKFGKTKNLKLFRRQIGALFDSRVYEIRRLEQQLGPYIFGGRKYFHVTYDEGIDFFRAAKT